MTIHYSATKNAFFDDALKSDYEQFNSWPSDAIKMTDAEVSTYHGKQSPQGKQLGADANGRPIWVDLPPPSLGDANAAKSKQINDEAQKFIDANMPSYPSFEMLTFAKQEAEARAYIADNTIVTPVLTPIATERGLMVADLAAKVVAKADAFTALSASVAGQRQKYQDELTIAYNGGNGSLDAINAINPIYTLPA
uniref:Uncharacterized protein n=1 Tax=Hydrogenovibrio crunogenus (strain DSM 25203 / XCL-2) TaxID=317025 RepID=Q31HT5_HYDCU